MLSGIWGDIGKCSKCESNPKLKEAWGCEGKAKLDRPLAIEIVGEKTFKYWSCPKKFIPLSIWNFYDIYQYYKSFPSASMPEYNNVSKRFWLACKVLESKLIENEEAKQRG